MMASLSQRLAACARWNEAKAATAWEHGDMQVALRHTAQAQRLWLQAALATRVKHHAEAGDARKPR